KLNQNSIKMAPREKKQNFKKPSVGTSLSQSGLAVKTTKQKKQLLSSTHGKWLAVTLIMLLTFAAYFPSLQNGMLKTWDDQAYVTNNSLIKNIDGASILKIFKEDRGLYANYHPITTLSLAINYHFSKDKPFGYHLTNLFLHILNTLLVFIFIFRLSKNNITIATISSLLFGINPIHVESVAWISERKDVLYAFFYLASIVAYQKFLQKSDWKLYTLSLLLFIFSMLSKAMAASLPVALILIGFFESRKWNLKLFLDKIPYLMIAVALGYYAIQIQADGKAIGSETFPFFSRILHAGHGFSVYIFKILLPVNLSAFYPYPYPLINGAWVTNTIPASFYLTLLSTLALVGFSILWFFSKNKNLSVIGFGLLFYAITIALVLQFLPVGRAIMADRYSYIPSIGVFFILGYLVNILLQNRPKRRIIPILIALYSVYLFYLTFQQCKVWKNDETLWSNTISINPNDNRIALVYENRALYYQIMGRPEKALSDFLKVSEWNSKNANTLQLIGKIYGKDLNDLGKSILYFEKAYLLNPNDLSLIQDMVTAYGIKGDYGKSLEYSLLGLKIDDKNAFLLYNAGITYTNIGQLELGKQYIAKALETDPTIIKK
ncbi:MAG: glycosyltransferase family 39 protein, partial [Bacteroidia bacterium]